MNPSMGAVRRKILYTIEDIQSWTPWHCRKLNCHHHMCRVRLDKLDALYYTLDKLYIKFQILKEQKRRLNI